MGFCFFGGGFDDFLLPMQEDLLAASLAGLQRDEPKGDSPSWSRLGSCSSSGAQQVSLTKGTALQGAVADLQPYAARGTYFWVAVQSFWLSARRCFVMCAETSKAEEAFEMPCWAVALAEARRGRKREIQLV